MEKRGIVVSNLPYFFGNNELHDLFSECGKVKHYMIIRSSAVDEVNDKGIVFFEEEMSVDFALNMNERVIAGKSLYVFPITDEIKASLYKLNIPFFRDRNAVAKEAGGKSSAKNEKESSEEKPQVPEDDVIDSPYKLKIFGLKPGVTERQIRDGCAMVTGIEQVVILPPRKKNDGVLGLLIFGTCKHCEIALQKFKQHNVVIDDAVVKIKPYRESITVINAWLAKRPNEPRLKINVEEANKANTTNSQSQGGSSTPNNRKKRNPSMDHSAGAGKPQSPRTVHPEEGGRKQRTLSQDQVPGSPLSSAKGNSGLPKESPNRNRNKNRNRSRSRSRSRSLSRG